MAGTPPLFLTTTYFYLFMSTLITAISAQYPITHGVIGLVVFFILSIVLLFIVQGMSPGLLKHVLYVILLISLGQLFSLPGKKLQSEDTIRNTLVMVAGIFLGMTALAFYDKDNFLGFGPYLFAGLIGLILARLGMSLWGYEKGITEEFKRWDKILSYVGVGLFALYTAYDTQQLKKYGKSLGANGKPDYINASMGLYLDILNLFVSVDDIMG